MNDEQRALVARRQDLVKQLQALPERALAQYVIDNKLPAATSKWTLDDLQNTINHFQKAPTMATTTQTAPAAKKAAAKKAPASVTPAVMAAFLVSFASEAKGSPRVQGFATAEEATAAGEQVEAGHECYVITKAEDLKELEKPTMLAIFNKTVATPVEKFANRATANEQVFSALPKVAEAQSPAPAAKKAAAKKAASDGAKGGGRRTAVTYTPKAADQIKAVRSGTKLAQLIDLMFRPEGTTLEEITTELSKVGKPIIARAWLGYDFASIAGYGARQDEQGRIYGVLPKGMTAPLPHKPTAEEEKAAKKAEKAQAAAAKPPAAKKAAAKKAAPAPEPAQEQGEGNVNAPSNEAADAATATETPAPAHPEAPVPAPAKKAAAKKGAAKKASK